MEIYGCCLAAEAPTILERGLRYMLGMDSRFPIFFVILSRPLGILLLLHDGLGLEKEKAYLSVDPKGIKEMRVSILNGTCIRSSMRTFIPVQGSDEETYTGRFLLLAS
jgi:hypothetical protein